MLDTSVASTIIGISKDQEICLIIGQFHLVYSIRGETSRRIYVVREEIDEKTVDIQARSSLARTLEINGKARQAEGEAKVVR